MHQPRRKALISAITYGNKKSQTIILLPPGDGVGNHFDELSRILSQHFFVVVVNLPGTTKGACGDCTIDSIVNSICTYIDSEKILNPIVIGESYGAVIAMRISSIIALKKIVLIGCGNFFNFPTKLFLTLLFIPPQLHQRIRRSYARVISRFPFFDFSDYDDCQLKCILKRWNEIIWYKNPKISCDIPALIINSTRDEIVNRDSINHIRNSFPNQKIIELKCSHFDYLEHIMSDHKQMLLDFLQSRF